MRLLLDEDSQSRLLTRLLANAGHDVLTVAGANLTAHSDTNVFTFARQSGRTVLTRNVRDFLVLHEAEADHHGILAEYQDANPAKNMSAARIVEAIANLESSGWDIGGQFIALNAWDFEPPRIVE